jgi:hypothetical protein
VCTNEKTPPPLRVYDDWESLPFQTSQKYVQKNSKLSEAPSACQISQGYSSFFLKFEVGER